MFEKALGSIYGQIIGDILGNSYKDLKEYQAKQKVIHNTKNNILTIVKGYNYLGKGQLSGNGEMSMAMVRCLYRYKDYIKEQMYQYYKLWWISRGRDLDIKKYNHFDNSTNYSNLVHISECHYKTNYNNSCLMRVTPLAIFGHNISIEKLKKYIAYDCNMTNPNMISLDRVTVYILSIRDALNGLSKDEIYKNAIKNCKRVENKYILESSKIRPQPSINDNLIYNDNDRISNSCVALQNTFFELLHSTNFHNSMVSIINRGGDTNTNCSIAGGLLGAYYGITNIPESWKYVVKNVDKDNYDRYNRIKTYPISSTLDIDKLVNGLFYPHKITIFNTIYCVNNNYQKTNTMTIKSEEDTITTKVNEDKYRKKIDTAIIKIKHIFNDKKYRKISIDKNLKYPKEMSKRVNFYLKIKLSKLIHDLNTC